MNIPQATHGARVGHVHLKVSSLERAVAFYRDVLGMQVMSRYGEHAAFLSYGGYHHHLGLNTWESEGAPPPPRYTSGLYHLALLYPSREALATVVSRVVEAGVALDGASDHGVSEAIYLRDPDQNGVELYHDRPPEQWPRDAKGDLAMFTRRLDLKELLS
jgi:catechol 2,3-dioxygenase